jgi:carbamoyltransferase
MRQLYEYHPIVGYRYVPNLRARVQHESGGYLVQVNADGFRSDRPFDKTATPGKRRVLVFGDSFTAGDGVANAHRYTDLLEGLLPNTEVYNYGLSSTGTDQQFLAWREFAREVEHDVLVIAVFVENIRRVVARYRPHGEAGGQTRLYAKPYYEIEGGQLVLRNTPVPPAPLEFGDLSLTERNAVDNGGPFPILRGLVNCLGAKGTIQRLTHYQPLPAYSTKESAGWQLMCAILKQWAKEYAGRIVLMPLPLPQHLDEACDPSQYQARFTELAGEASFILHDPLPALLRYPKQVRRGFRWERDIHFTPDGHRALAHSLAPLLKSFLCKSN